MLGVNVPAGKVGWKRRQCGAAQFVKETIKIGHRKVHGSTWGVTGV